MYDTYLFANRVKALKAIPVGRGACGREGPGSTAAGPFFVASRGLPSEGQLTGPLSAAGTNPGDATLAGGVRRPRSQRARGHTRVFCMGRPRAAGGTSHGRAPAGGGPASPEGLGEACARRRPRATPVLGRRGSPAPRDPGQRGVSGRDQADNAPFPSALDLLRRLPRFVRYTLSRASAERSPVRPASGTDAALGRGARGTHSGAVALRVVRPGAERGPSPESAPDC